MLIPIHVASLQPDISQPTAISNKIVISAVQDATTFKYKPVVFPIAASNYTNTITIPQKQAAQEAIQEAQQALDAQTVDSTAAVVVQAPEQVTQPTGCYSAQAVAWMQQAGIVDIPDAQLVLTRESNCDPDAQNGSGACGIGQQLPCGKWPHLWNDAVGGMIDAQNYVLGTYGSWANAEAHEISSGWY